MPALIRHTVVPGDHKDRPYALSYPDGFEQVLLPSECTEDPLGRNKSAGIPTMMCYYFNDPQIEEQKETS